MSSPSPETVDEYRKYYDKYIEKIVEKIEKTEDERKAIEANLRSLKEDKIFSSFEVQSRKNRKETALRRLNQEKETAKGIRARIMQPGKDDMAKVPQEIEGLEFYNAGEWKD